MQIAAREMAWGQKPIDKWWLCFTAEQDNSTVRKELWEPYNGKHETQEISLNNGRTWKPYEQEAVITLSKKGDKVYFRAGSGGNTTATLPEGFVYAGTFGAFRMTGKIAASGNVMSLIDGEKPVTTIPSSCCFQSLFKGCNALTTPPDLPATELTEWCYYSMFEGCTSLTEAPELPATTLTDGCYAVMFKDCSSLTLAPTLPATELTSQCYEQMFSGCSSLTEAPELPAKTLALRCYNQMFGQITEVQTVVSKISRLVVHFDAFIGTKNETKTTMGTWAWVNGIVNNGTFVCHGELGNNETIRRGHSYCPTNWTVENFKQDLTLDKPGVYIFNEVTTNTATLPKAVKADILLVGGGGGGANPGSIRNYSAGGGGAGGMIEVLGGYLEAGFYNIVVGNGGVSPETQGAGANGESSKILLSGVAKYEALGGGGGGIQGVGLDGGSGGGGSNADGGSGMSGQGNAGGGVKGFLDAGSGGGGAGGAGGNASAHNVGGIGGLGKVSSITGYEIYYAAGGGGGTRRGAASALGGSGIGGNGGYEGGSATNGRKNTGSGGGGGSLNTKGGNGGSGIVVIRVTEILD